MYPVESLTPIIMKIIFCLTVLSFLTTMAYGEPVHQKQLTISGIRQIIIETPGDLDIRPGLEERLVVETDKKTLEQLDSFAENDILYLRSKGNFSAPHGLRYLVVTRALNRLTIHGSSNSTVGAFKGDALNIELVGSGGAVLKDIEFHRLVLRITGSGSIEAHGHGQELSAELNGSGEIRTQHYTVTQAEVKIADLGVGNISVQASKHLKAAIEGVGSIRYKGHPKISQSILGVGLIEPLLNP